jgi:predicted nucleotidyltransferase component of viral defense system
VNKLDSIELREAIIAVLNVLKINPIFIEKDYYLTLILLQIDKLNPNLIFKGGTALNKLYLDYSRISEDLDFTLNSQPQTRGEEKRGISSRSSIFRDIKNNISSFMEQFSLKFISHKKYDNSRLQVYEFGYTSIVNNTRENSKINIDIRCHNNDVILTPEYREVKHKFSQNIIKASISTMDKVKTCQLIEIMAQKLTALLDRNVPRDFFDIYYAARQGFSFTDDKFVALFVNNLQNSKLLDDVEKFRFNLGKNLNDLIKLRAEAEITLIPMILKGRNDYKIEKTLEIFNKIMPEIISKIKLIKKKGS